MNDNQMNPNQNQFPQGGAPMDPQQYMAWYQQQQMMQQNAQNQMPPQNNSGMGMPQTPMGGMNQGMPGQMPSGMGMPQAPMGGMNQGMPGQMPGGMGMPQAPMGGMNQGMPGQMPSGMGMPQAPMGGMPSAPQTANPQGTQPMMVDGKLNESLMVRDPNVLNFMAQAVREKNKDTQVTDEFVQKEAERLYDKFGEELVEHFEPMLTKDQIAQFDGMLQSGATQDQLLSFLMSSIPDLTQKIEQVLLSYKDKYLMSM